ncbi:MAG: hypothetical protein R3Y60_00875 [bacterium]
MNKNNVFMRHVKRTLSVFLATVVMITLSGCAESTDKNPYGSLETTSIYAKSGDYSITVGDLYDELRHNSLGYLNQRMDEIVFDDYLNGDNKTVDSTNEDQQLYVAEKILTDIHGTYDEEEIEDINDFTKSQNIAKYADSMYLGGITIDTVDLEYYNVDDIIDYGVVTKLWDAYSTEVAKYLYAIDVLTQEINEHNDEAEDNDDLDVYFTDEEIATFFDNTYSYENDVQAIIIRFINQTEADAVLKKFGIKSFNGEWYLIQPPVNSTGQTDWSKWSNESDYNEYYDEYTISQTNSGYSDSPISVLGSETTILKIFVEIYNYIYTYRNELTYTNQLNGSGSNTNFLYYYNLMTSIIANDASTSGLATSYENLVSTLSNSDYTTFTKEKLDTFSTSLTTYVHDTLRTEGELDEDTNEVGSYIQYTASARSYNSNYYLIYKMTDAVTVDFYETSEDEDGNTVYEFDMDILASVVNVDSEETLYDQILNDLFDAELTDSYISNKATTRAENLTVTIYDSILDFYYEQSNTSYTGSKGTDSDNIAKIVFNDGKDKWTIHISVEDTYAFLEPIYGTYTATSKLFEQYIVDSTYYSDILDEEDSYQTYKDSVYFTLTYFANGSYESYGYPASIGKYAFMKNFYRTANIDEAIDYLMLQDAKREYFLDIDDSFYNEMFGFTSAAYDNFYSLNLSNILVYVDMDEDGIPDTDWFTADDAGWSTSSSDYLLSSTQKQNLAQNLIEEIIDYLYHSTDSLSESFANVIEEFNSSTRIEPGNDSELSGSVEERWAKYRKHGLYISTSDLGTFSNTTFDTESKIQDIVEDLYRGDDTNYKEIMMNNSFTGSTLLEGSSNFIMTDGGMNLLLVTSGEALTEIDFENEDEDLYLNVPIKIGDSYKIYESLASTGENANLTQVEVYCREFFTSGSSVSLSSSATTYLDTYLKPALEKYNSQVVQLMIISNELGSIEWTGSTTGEQGLQDYITYLQRVSDEYVDNSNTNFAGFWDFVDNINPKGGSN